MMANKWPQTSYILDNNCNCHEFLLADLYGRLAELPFPAGFRATDELKACLLLDPGLVRAVNKKTLFEKRKSGKEVKFNLAAIQEPKWLFIGDDGAYCIYCKLYCNEANKPRVKGALTSSAWKLYSRMKSLEDHEATAYHKFADGADQQYKASVLGSGAPVNRSAARMSQQYRDTVKLLNSIVVSVDVAAKQNLPLRGHRNEHITPATFPLSTKTSGNEEIIVGDVNQGNMIMLLRYAGWAGDGGLGKIHELPNTYTAPAMQNEILSTVGQQVNL